MFSLIKLFEVTTDAKIFFFCVCVCVCGGSLRESRRLLPRSPTPYWLWKGFQIILKKKKNISVYVILVWTLSVFFVSKDCRKYLYTLSLASSYRYIFFFFFFFFLLDWKILLEWKIQYSSLSRFLCNTL